MSILEMLLRTVLLAGRVHASYPDIPMERVTAASSAAQLAEEASGVPAEVLMAIAPHESDLQPNAVSWKLPGHERTDVLWKPGVVLPPRVVCGYVQAMSTSSVCPQLIAKDGGMSAGAAEFAEWLGNCHGDLPCSLRGHAGGWACSRNSFACTPAQRMFATTFYQIALRLGLPCDRLGSCRTRPAQPAARGSTSAPAS